MNQQIVQYRNHFARKIVGINGRNIKNVQNELKNTQKFAKKKKVFENNYLCGQDLRIIQHVPIIGPDTLQEFHAERAFIGRELNQFLPCTSLYLIHRNI